MFFPHIQYGLHKRKYLFLPHNKRHNQKHFLEIAKNNQEEAFVSNV
jgi:hypothetical protein